MDVRSRSSLTQVVGQLLALSLKLNILFAQLSYLLGSGNELIAEVLGSDGQLQNIPSTEC
jgi:hypothetical protein